MKEILLDAIATHPSLDNKLHLMEEVERLYDQIEELEEDAWKLSCLEQAGVDNWSGYDYAMELMREEEE